MNIVDLFNSATGTKQSEFGATTNPSVSGNAGVKGNGDLLDWIGRGADIYRNVKGADSITAPETRSGTTPGIKSTLASAQWLPYALIGGVLLIIAVIFFRR